MEADTTFVRIQVPTLGKGSDERLDRYISDHVEEVSKQSMSRSFVQKAIKSGLVHVNGNVTTKLGYKVRSKDVIQIDLNTRVESTSLPEGVVDENPSILKPEQMNLEIIYEDDWILVINKPAGVMVHPSPGHLTGTLVNGLLFHCKELSTLEGDPERPGIVHRLDKDTAGLMVIAKENQAHQNLKNQFQSRTIVKMYSTVVVGKPKDEGGWNRIEKPIARHPKDINKMVISSQGKESVTEYMVKEAWTYKKFTYTMLDVQIHTGRTHQIRVHMSSLGTPIVGDPIYSTKYAKHQVPFLLLVSRFLEFEHPTTKKRLSFQIDVPQHMKDFIQLTNR